VPSADHEPRGEPEARAAAHDGAARPRHLAGARRQAVRGDATRVGARSASSASPARPAPARARSSPSSPASTPGGPRRTERLGRCAVVAFDPKSPITGGALLGDRLRVDFNNLGERVFYRSLAIGGEDYHALDDIIELIGGAHEGDDAFDTVFVETVGAGRTRPSIREHVDTTAVVLTPGMGDAVQMDKAGILEIADLFVCNKADHPGEHELVRDLRDIAGKRADLRDRRDALAHTLREAVAAYARTLAEIGVGPVALKRLIRGDAEAGGG
jgi:hypothetical protein